MNSETPKVQVVIDKEYYERLLENQKTPEQARKFIKFIASTLRGFKGDKLWNHSETLTQSFLWLVLWIYVVVVVRMMVEVWIWLVPDKAP